MRTSYLLCLMYASLPAPLGLPSSAAAAEAPVTQHTATPQEIAAVRARLTPAPSSGPAAEAAINDAIHAILHPGCGKSEAAHLAAAARNQYGPRAYSSRSEWDSTDVLGNSLDIELFPTTRTIAGTNTMTVRAVTDAESLTFTLAPSFTVTSVLLNGTTPLTPTNVGVWGRRVVFPTPIAAGTQFTLTIAYNGSPLNVGLGGFVWTRSSSPIQVHTLSQPYFSGSWWPTKDGDVGAPGNNTDKATFEIKVTAPFNVTTVANGLLQSTTNLANPLRKRTHWKTNYQLPPYLAAFATAQYRYWTNTYNDTRDDGTAISMPVQFAVTATSDTPAFRAAFEGVTPMLGLFKPRFGLYPFANEKYGIYEFSFGGGMEHSTYTGQSNGQPYLNAHELAHQWWGDDVTCRTWSDIFLNEGMATYSEAMFYELSAGPEWLSWWMQNVRSVNAADPRSVYVYDTNNTGWIFSGNTTYNKGAWVFHMLRGMVGDDTFWTILKSWRAMYSGSGGTTDDFIAVAEAVSGRDLSDFFDFWVYRPGTLDLRSGYREVLANGRGFVKVSHRQIQSDSIGTIKMPVPITYSTTGPTNITETLQLNGSRIQHHVKAARDGERIPFGLVDANDWVLGTQWNEDYVQGPPVVLTTSLDAPGTANLPGAQTITGPLSALKVWFSDAVDVNYRQTFLVDAQGKRVKSDPEPDDAGMFLRLNFGRPLAAGTYTLRIPSGAVTLQTDAAAPNGRTLDGETVNGTLPSGDGVAGGDYVLTFTVENPADFNRDGFVTFEDADAFVNAFESGEPGADLDADGMLTFEDFDTFTMLIDEQ
ncbi:MAG: M1 family aminopeptidase [Planctomycetota bacterium]|nr:M1 family aminopeptidase [Planctomycetota bacterium]